MRAALLTGFGLLFGLAACGGGAGSTASTVPNGLQPDSLSIQALKPPITYTIAGPCGIVACSSTLLLNGVAVGTVSYADGVQYFTNTNFAGSVSLLGRTYTDLYGTFSGSGNVWTLNGTFGRGKDQFFESFNVVGHSGRGGGYTITNLGGSIVTPFHTAPPPTPRPSPTPRPTPTPDS